MGFKGIGSRKRGLLLVAGVILVALSVFLITYGLVVYFALERAGEERDQESRQALQDELENQMDLARNDIDAGHYELALRRLDWILELSPTFPGAAEMKQIAQSEAAQRLTPSATATIEPTATPTATRDLGDDPSAALEKIVALIEDESWQEAVGEILAFQIRFPDYERRRTDEMLFDASVNLGLELVQGRQIELGLYYLSQAESLGDLPQEAEDYRTWAELYLSGISFVGVDWGQAIYYFRGLCSAAPYYQDSCARLYESLVTYGDLYAASMDWCPAEELYFEAILIERSEAMSEKLENARLRCFDATPTPTIDISPSAVPTSTP